MATGVPLKAPECWTRWLKDTREEVCSTGMLRLRDENFNYTLVHAILASNNTSVCEKWFTHYRNDHASAMQCFNATDKEGDRPIHSAIRSHVQPHIISTFLKEAEFIDPSLRRDILVSVNNKGECPLQFAYTLHNLDLIELLLGECIHFNSLGELMGIHRDPKKCRTKTLLHRAMKYGDISYLRIYLTVCRKESNLLSEEILAGMLIPDEKNRTPWFYFLAMEYSKIVEALDILQEFHVSLNELYCEVDEAGEPKAYMLHEASRQEKKEVIKLLSDYGAKLNKKDGNGLTPKQRSRLIECSEETPCKSEGSANGVSGLGNGNVKRKLNFESGGAVRPSAGHNEIASPQSNQVETSPQAGSAGETHSNSSGQASIPNPDQMDTANTVHLDDLPSLDHPSNHSNRLETSSKAGSAGETHSNSSVQAPIPNPDRVDADSVHTVRLDDPSNHMSNDDSSQSVIISEQWENGDGPAPLNQLENPTENERVNSIQSVQSYDGLEERQESSESHTVASPLVFIGSGPPLVCHDHLHCTPSATEIPITTNLPRLKLLTEDYTDSLECRDTVLEFNSSGASFLCQVSDPTLYEAHRFLAISSPSCNRYGRPHLPDCRPLRQLNIADHSHVIVVELSSFCAPFLGEVQMEHPQTSGETCLITNTTQGRSAHC